MNALRLATLLACAAGLAACATGPDTPYPSLAVREAEYQMGQIPRPSGNCAKCPEMPATGEFEPPAPVAPPPPPPVLSTDLLERVAQLEAQAREAHADFERAVPATRSAVRASGIVGSKSWGRAEVAYANLRSIRARTSIPLADLDTLVAVRSVDGEPVEEIVAARNAVLALIDQEDGVLDELSLR
tara:strand:- start:871 stop:1428 length:558 start_codon:yes stop_codon:yes gene_type:complete